MVVARLETQVWQRFYNGNEYICVPVIWVQRAYQRIRSRTVRICRSRVGRGRGGGGGGGGDEVKLKAWRHDNHKPLTTPRALHVKFSPLLWGNCNWWSVQCLITQLQVNEDLFFSEYTHTVLPYHNTDSDSCTEWYFMIYRTSSHQHAITKPTGVLRYGEIRNNWVWKLNAVNLMRIVIYIAPVELGRGALSGFQILFLSDTPPLDSEILTSRSYSSTNKWLAHRLSINAIREKVNIKINFSFLASRKEGPLRI